MNDSIDCDLILCIIILCFSTLLGLHLRGHHSDITTWSCSHCTRQFPTYHSLYTHMHFYHREGQFKCGHDGCDFEVATLRSVIKNHQATVHRSTLYTCDLNNCGKSFVRVSDFQNHRRCHLGLKPYLCNWTECNYASFCRSAVVRHIRSKHFNLPRTLKQQQAQGLVDDRNPRDYLRVDTELLEQSSN